LFDNYYNIKNNISWFLISWYLYLSYVYLCRQTSLWKKNAVVFTTVTISAKQDQLNGKFLLAWRFWMNCTRLLLGTPILHFYALKHDTTNQTVIGCLAYRWGKLFGGPWRMKAALASKPPYAWLFELNNHILWRVWNRYTWCTMYFNVQQLSIWDM